MLVTANCIEMFCSLDWVNKWSACLFTCVHPVRPPLSLVTSKHITDELEMWSGCLVDSLYQMDVLMHTGQDYPEKVDQ